MGEETVVATKDLTKIYDGTTVVDHLNLRVTKKEIFGLLGPNGAGKTTTILMLLGLTEPASGNVKVCGFNPIREPLKVKRVVGYMPEKVGFYENLTAKENLDFIAQLNNIDAAKASSKINELLDSVGLNEVGDQQVGKFSRAPKACRCDGDPTLDWLLLKLRTDLFDRSRMPAKSLPDSACGRRGFSALGGNQTSRLPGRRMGWSTSSRF